MPIPQWLFKSSSTTCSRSRREQCTNIEEGEVNKSREPVIFDRGNSEAEKESTFTILLRREDSRACFYSILQLKHLIHSLNLQREQYFELVKMGQKSEVGCKVLPICHGGSAGASNGGKINGDEWIEEEVQHIKRRRAVSRMKELIRWAAAAKAAGKGGIKGWKVLYFKSKKALKDPADYASSNSSKISFRWDVGSCSTSSSVFSPLSIPSAPLKLDHTWLRKQSNSNVSLQSSNANSGCNRVGGQWITSDSDFVVLEL